MTFHIKKSIEKNSYISWSAHNGSTQQSWIINGSTLIPLDWAYLSLGGR
jgi:hypothetical protein